MPGLNRLCPSPTRGGEHGHHSHQATTQALHLQATLQGLRPLHRRLPKQGFTNIFASDFAEINVGRLASLAAGTVVTAELLKQVCSGSDDFIARMGGDEFFILGERPAADEIIRLMDKISSAEQIRFVVTIRSGLQYEMSE